MLPVYIISTYRQIIKTVSTIQFSIICNKTFIILIISKIMMSLCVSRSNVKLLPNEHTALMRNYFDYDIVYCNCQLSIVTLISIKRDIIDNIPFYSVKLIRNIKRYKFS